MLRPVRIPELMIVACTFALAPPALGQDSSRKIPCKTAAEANACYWTHGRITGGSGNPAIRLWKIGTDRILGVYSGPSVNRFGQDNESPELPANLSRVFHPAENWVFGDFEVCPLEPERKGAMQAVCIEAAKNLRVSQ
jgi:hypothetical protein